MARRSITVAAGVLVALALGTSACSASTDAAASPARHTPVRHGKVSASRCATNRTAGPVTFVSPFGYDASAGIIDAFAAQSLGYFAAECLTVRFIASTYTPTELVSSGAGTITGEGSAADALVQIAGGQAVTAVATFGDVSDYALLTAPGISSLRALAHKKIAYHEVFPAILRALLERAGVRLSSVDFVNDTTYNPKLLETGAFSGLQAYRSNEPLELRAAHLGFHEYTPAQFHIPGTFNVVVVNSAFLARHRSTVADFLRADLHAFSYCAAHEKRCVAIEAAAAAAHGATYDRAHSLAEWRLEARLALGHRLAGHGVGVETRAEWRPEARLLVDQHVLSHVPGLSRAEDTRLAASLYRGTHLVWPGP